MPEFQIMGALTRALKSVYIDAVDMGNDIFRPIVAIAGYDAAADGSKILPAVLPVVTGPLTAVAQTLAARCDQAGAVVVAMHTAALANHGVVFEVSLNSTNGTDGNWYAVQATRSDSGLIETGAAALAATPAFAWEINVNGFRWFRVRCTTHTSGTATWTIQRSILSAETVVSLGALGAEDAAAVGNAMRVGGRVRTAPLTTLVANDAADLMMDPAGAAVVKAHAPNGAVWNASVALTTTTPAVVQGAAGAGLHRRITALQAINTGAAVVDLILLDGVTERWRLPLPINVPVSVPMELPLITTANTALNANLSAAGTVRLNAQGYTSV